MLPLLRPSSKLSRSHRTLSKFHSFASSSILPQCFGRIARDLSVYLLCYHCRRAYFLLLRIWERSKSAENTRIALVGGIPLGTCRMRRRIKRVESHEVLALLVPVTLIDDLQSNCVSGWRCSCPLAWCARNSWLYFWPFDDDTVDDLRYRRRDTCSAIPI